jgi:hypothetical protein
MKAMVFRVGRWASAICEPPCPSLSPESISPRLSAARLRRNCNPAPSYGFAMKLDILKRYRFLAVRQSGLLRASDADLQPYFQADTARRKETEALPLWSVDKKFLCIAA